MGCAGSARNRLFYEGSPEHSASAGARDILERTKAINSGPPYSGGLAGNHGLSSSQRRECPAMAEWTGRPR